jgi:hypothetical protein
LFEWNFAVAFWTADAGGDAAQQTPRKVCSTTTYFVPATPQS